MTKHYFFLSLFLSLSWCVAAQSDPPPPNKEVPPREEILTPLQPTFPGGDMALKAFLDENLVYPQALKDNKIQGWVVASFLIEKDGSITDIQVVRDIGGGAAAEVKRVIGLMPKWIRAEESHSKIRMTLPVQFRLDADHDEHKPTAKNSSSILDMKDLNTVWEAVRLKTQEIYQENEVTPSFKIKSDKDSRLDLVHALEGQFQVNIGNDEIRSLKKAADLRDYLYEAQNGPITFSKINFQGKVERLGTKRKNCKEDFDCLNFIGSMFVPKGVIVTLYNDKKFKGEYLRIDARNQAIEIPTFFDIKVEGNISSNNAGYNWRESTHSIKIEFSKK